MTENLTILEKPPIEIVATTPNTPTDEIQNFLIKPEIGKGSIIAMRKNEDWVFMGDFTATYPNRFAFKRGGAKWNKSLKNWMYTGLRLTDDIKAIGEFIDVTASEIDPDDVDLSNITDVLMSAFQVKPADEPEETGLATPSTDETALPNWYTKPSWWDYINIYIDRRPATAIVGPAGNGKTTTCEIALKAQGFEFESLSCTDRTEVVDLVGGTILTTNGEEWVDGIVTRCFREGKAVILDELDALDPRVMMCLQNALQDAGPDNTGRYVSTPAGRVYPSGKCPILMTMNTVGSGATRQYVGRNRLDSASMDRITILQTGYENEVEVLKKRGAIKGRLAKKIVTWAETTRKHIDNAGLALVLSPRTLLRIGESVQDIRMEFELACELEFFSRLEADQREIVEVMAS